MTAIGSDPRPLWALEPFHRFLDYLDTERQLLQLAVGGIHMASRRDQALEVLYGPLLSGEGFTSLTDITREEAESQVEEARRISDLARSEVEAEFPLLHAHSLLGNWGALSPSLTTSFAPG